MRCVSAPSQPCFKLAISNLALSSFLSLLASHWHYSFNWLSVYSIVFIRLYIIYFILFFFSFLSFFLFFLFLLSPTHSQELAHTMTGSSNSILIGCLVGVLSLAAQSIGLTLQRKSHLIEDAKLTSQHHRPPYRRPLWRLGCFLFIMSNVVGSSIQISTLPLIVLSPLQAVGLVFNSICGSLILSELFTKFTFRGTLLVSIGAFFIAYFGPIPEPNHNLQELLDLLKRKSFLIWFNFSILLLVSVLGYIKVLDWYLSRENKFLLNLGDYYGSISPENHQDEPFHHEVEQLPSKVPSGPQETDRLLPSSTSISSTTSRDYVSLSNRPVSASSSSFSGLSEKFKLRFFNNRRVNKVINFFDFVSKDHISFVQGVLYGIICGILSAHALLLAKSAVELLIIAITEKTLTDLKSYQSWLIISGWVFCAIMQVYYLNLGLKIISSSIIFPLIFCVYNIVNILNGLIYFDQFSRLSINEMAFIFTGVLLILFGVFYLSINCESSCQSEVDPEDVQGIQSAGESDEEADTIAPLDIAAQNLKSGFHDGNKYSYHHHKLSGTPASTVSKCQSIATNPSLKPILPESFTSHKLHIDDDK